MTAKQPSAPRATVRPSMRIRAMAGAALATLALSIAACNDSTGPGSLLLAAGSYDLRAVGGTPLPASVGSALAVRGSLQIQTNARYALSEIDSSASGLSEFTSAGKWSAPGGTVQFQDDNGTLVLLGALSGSADSINVTVNGHLDTYVRN